MHVSSKIIVVVTDNLPPVYGGADIAAWKYAKLLEARGIDGIIVGSNNPKVAFNEYKFNRYKGIGYYKNNKISGRVKIIYDWLTFVSCYISVFYFFLVNFTKIKVVHSFNTSAVINTCFIKISKTFNIPTITETSLMGSDDPHTIYKSGSFKKKLTASYISRQFAKSATLYISKSGFISNSFKESPLCNKYVEVPYMVDTNVYVPLSHESKQKLRRKLNLPVDKIIILYVGGINPRKGVHILIDSFKRLLEESKGIYLLLVGPTEKYDASYVSKVSSNIKEIGTGNAMLVGGISSNVYEWMQASDIYCLPSFKEGFPISIVEALSSGLLVVASDIPEIKGVQIIHGSNGFLFTCGDTGSLYNVLKECLSYNQATIRDSARTIAVKKYHTDVVVSSYLKLYNQIVLH